MTTRVHTEQAKAGQRFFGLPEYNPAVTPTATINGGASVPLTAVPSGVVLTTAAAQNDVVRITFDQLYYG
ncbi:hypothetical protein EHF44_10685 [Cupriavidus pauculus]|uniref:Uncharacterized protein n=1 Tax=Cupriavidus pauculus TaxID=82633 RepID=A0A3G8H034_9BURK|nr:hypothetical protein EHF44_10685 [Cupriavidus pauculus]